MSPEVREWCRQECIRQHATSREEFEGMEKAWEAASVWAEIGKPVDVLMIQRLARLVDPIANPGGRFRTGPAVFMSGGSSSQAGEIEYRLTNLIKWLDAGMTPNEFYQTLMWIHPWRDGNGRVGALVYNILNGTILNPVVPPEYGG